MNRRITFLLGLLWTLRYGRRGDIEWPWYMRSLPIALLSVWEVYCTLLAWDTAHLDSDASMVIFNALLTVWNLYVVPSAIIQLLQRWW
ncbi:hypothetical protein [Mycolicibacterium wolinskyi]|uniref:hypothetical protein n=1 Tax=Mycolicibacterium wolinskyi TaxID=59750 RepID=UPI003917B242